MGERFSMAARVKSFHYAFRGVAVLLRTQHNAWLHVIASVAVIALGLFLGVSIDDWCWLVLAMGSVWGAEAMNTAVEHLADAAVPDPHPLIEQAKDVAAAGVLLTAIFSAVLGLLVLGPPLLTWLGLAPA